jgi:hypothetical protein
MMSEQYGEEKRENDNEISAEEREKIAQMSDHDLAVALGKELNRIDDHNESSPLLEALSAEFDSRPTNVTLPPDFHEKLMQEVRERWPEDQSTVDRLNTERNQRRSEHDGRC